MINANPLKFPKSLEKMRALACCQSTLGKLVFSSIDRRSKAIKKHEKQVSDSLKKR
jgi:hypothetical protein